VVRSITEKKGENLIFLCVLLPVLTGGGSAYRDWGQMWNVIKKGVNKQGRRAGGGGESQEWKAG